MTKAIIITIGTELTDGRVLDTNTGYVARNLEQQGIRVGLNLSVPDDRGEIGRALAYVLEKKPKLVVLAGGLGPTEDDLTAAAVGAALGLEMEINPQARAFVQTAVKAEEELKPHQLKQARMPAGSRAVKPAGTAPGFVLKANDSIIIALPGVPFELKAMWDDVRRVPEVAPVIDAARSPLRSRLCFYGIGEPQIGRAVEAIVGKAQAGLEISICSRRGEVLLEVVSTNDSQDQVKNLMATLKERFGDAVYSEGEGIEAVVGAALAEADKTLAVGESCTGGMLGEAITRVAGASAFFLGGVIAYSNEAKRDVLKVRQETLDNVGAVSEPVAQQLALGVRALTGADYGAGITGVAGPSGGTAEKPVGLVYICVSSSQGDVVRGFNFPGARDDIREASVTAVLHMLHAKILGDAPAAE